MRSYSKLIPLAAIAALIGACQRDVTRTYATSVPAGDVAGTYFAADSGHNLGKNWCYSAALVLDSTHHFGSVIRMCSDDGSGPVTESIKGTYSLRTTTVRMDNGDRVRKTNVVLNQDGTHKKRHTLVYENGTLRFDEPWWMGAGLRALGISDPVLKKVGSAALTDSASAAASSTPPTLKNSKKSARAK